MSLHLRAALAYVERFGFRVLPVHSVDASGHCTCGRAEAPGHKSGKHPRTPHGVSDASADVALVRRWWGQWPDASIGIATGGELLVLDKDPRNGGDETLADLEREHGALPETARAMTGGDGEHVFLRVDPALRFRGSLGPGVDVKHAGGYVVAAPSPHVSGKRYAWDLGHHLADTPIAPAPRWVVDLVGYMPPPVAPVTDRSAAPMPLAEGLLDALAAGCRFVERCADDAALISYEEWLSLATVLRPFAGGADLYDAISALDPRRYVAGEPKKKIATLTGAPRHCSNLGWTCPDRDDCAAIGVRSPAGLPYRLRTLARDAANAKARDAGL